MAVHEMKRTAAARLLAATLLLAATAAQAQIYKWVDEKGDTHYSSRKADAGRAKTEQLKVPSAGPAAAPPQAHASAPPWQPPSWTPPAYEPPVPPQPKVPPSLSGGREHGTDASRCALARDVLSGSVRHSNGKPIDKYDLDVANNDVKLFCR